MIIAGTTTTSALNLNNLEMKRAYKKADLPVSEIRRFLEPGPIVLVSSRWEEGAVVKAPLIKECYANYECKVADTQLLKGYNFFILEVMAARAAVYPKYPKTVHYRGEGIFMVSGKHINLSTKFKHQNL